MLKPSEVRSGISGQESTFLIFLAIETCLISYTIHWKLQGGIKVDMYRHAHATMELSSYSTFGFGYYATPSKSLPFWTFMFRIIHHR